MRERFKNRSMEGYHTIRLHYFPRAASIWPSAESGEYGVVINEPIVGGAELRGRSNRAIWRMAHRKLCVNPSIMAGHARTQVGHASSFPLYRPTMETHEQVHTTCRVHIPPRDMRVPVLISCCPSVPGVLVPFVGCAYTQSSTSSSSPNGARAPSTT